MGDSKSAQAASNKGGHDFAKSGGHVNSNPITEFFHPTYDPPSGNETQYKAGWDNAKSQSGSSGGSGK